MPAAPAVGAGPFGGGENRGEPVRAQRGGLAPAPVGGRATVAAQHAGGRFPGGGRDRHAPTRPAIAHARVSAAELALWQAKAAAAGVSLSELLRQAMARTQTWTAPAREVERARTRQIARIGSNLNQIARWAHTHVDDDLAVVEVLAHLVAIEREVAALRVRGASDAG